MNKVLICLMVILLTACDKATDNKLALGTLERDRIAHTATVNEVIVQLPVQPGSQVKQGDILVVLDTRLQEAALAKAQAELGQSQAHLEKLRRGAREEEVAQASANVAGAKAALIESEANYKRVKNLAENNLTSEANLSRALASRDKKLAALHAYEEALRQLTSGTRIEDLNMAEANLQAAKSVVISEQKKLSDLTIRATRDGILDNLPWNLGERATQGSPLAIVLAGKAPYARVYIPEPYRVAIKVGDTLKVRVDGLTEKFTGKVRWIAHDPAFSPYYALNQQERARLMYLAEVQLPDTAFDLPNGLPAQVELP
ncbi:HlyD family secretion protein [Litorilituus sediminis]|uniref:HlyD family efflux transporter periplasmic adaptor subunit n=1 Tax=Litorilituus sediminis TaxID=718192 RepID=A0A4P6P3Z6_9GAMM|nr:HlyD family efflux transporter periplasmic adaptor subunit [Litorilituus sediminis]QBG36316.1 HlyD family efflux transporter periplasmic adaptor subunit [Litorilituus sediminis]